MNRRRFIQSLAAVFTLPATPKLALGSAGAVSGTAAAVPTQARFWAIYMSALHGECTPQTLQNLLHIPEVDSKRYIGQLIADGVIKPNPLLKNTVSELVKPKDDSLVEKVKHRFEKKTDASAAKPELTEFTEKTDDEPEAQTELETEDSEFVHTDENIELDASEENLERAANGEELEENDAPSVNHA